VLLIIVRARIGLAHATWRGAIKLHVSTRSDAISHCSLACNLARTTTALPSTIRLVEIAVNKLTMIPICVALHHGQPFAWLRLRQCQRPSVMAKSKQVECGALTSESSLMSQIDWSHPCAIQHSNRLNPNAFVPNVNQQPIAFNPHANQFSDTFDFNVHQPPSTFNPNANIQASHNPQFLGGHPSYGIAENYGNVDSHATPGAPFYGAPHGSPQYEMPAWRTLVRTSQPGAHHSATSQPVPSQAGTSASGATCFESLYSATQANHTALSNTKSKAELLQIVKLCLMKGDRQSFSVIMENLPLIDLGNNTSSTASQSTAKNASGIDGAGR
jgi:hypothetical protein